MPAPVDVHGGEPGPQAERLGGASVNGGRTDVSTELADVTLRPSFDDTAGADTGGPIVPERAVVVIDADAPNATAERRPPQPAPRPKVRRRRRAVWARTRATPGRIAAATLLLAALAVPAALAGRAGIVRLAPQSAVVFAAVGLPVNLVGLDLAFVTSAMGESGGKPELTVEGQITNPGSGALTVPPVEIAIRGEDGALLYHWSVAAQDARLAAGETTRFRARLLSPPPAGRSVAVTFRAAPGNAAVALR